MSGVAYIGVDLGWRVKPPVIGGTGLCRMDQDGRVLELALATTDQEIVSFVQSASERVLAVAIDAPMIVKNPSGRRDCERALRALGHTAHSSNIPRLMGKPFFGIRGREIMNLLPPKEFLLTTERSLGSGCPVYEVYPAPTVKRLAGSKKLPHYKKGPKGTRQIAVRELLVKLDSAGWIRNRSEDLFPELSDDPMALSGKNLRGLADKFDALISAIIARSYQLEDPSIVVLGDRDSGFIITSR